MILIPGSYRGPPKLALPLMFPQNKNVPSDLCHCLGCDRLSASVPALQTAHASSLRITTCYNRPTLTTDTEDTDIIMLQTVQTAADMQTQFWVIMTPLRCSPRPGPDSVIRLCSSQWGPHRTLCCLQSTMCGRVWIVTWRRGQRYRALVMAG